MRGQCARTMLITIVLLFFIPPAIAMMDAEIGTDGAIIDADHDDITTWWRDGLAIDGGADGFFNAWLAERVNATADAAAAGSQRAAALRADCPYSVAFVFVETDGDGFVLDMGGAQGPSLEHVPPEAMPQMLEGGGKTLGAEGLLADLVLRLHSRRAFHGLIATAGETKQRAWAQALELGIFSATRLEVMPAYAEVAARERDLARLPHCVGLLDRMFREAKAVQPEEHGEDDVAVAAAYNEAIATDTYQRRPSAIFNPGSTLLAGRLPWGHASGVAARRAAAALAARDDGLNDTDWATATDYRCDLPRVSAADLAALPSDGAAREALFRGGATIITDLTRDWPAWELWSTPEQFNERFGNITLPPGMGGFPLGTPLSAFLAEFATRHSVAYELDPAFQAPGWCCGSPALRRATKRDWRIPSFLATAAVNKVLSIGGHPRGSEFAKHQVAWLGLVRGRKFWSVAPPHDPPPPRATCEYNADRRGPTRQCVLQAGPSRFRRTLFQIERAALLPGTATARILIPERRCFLCNSMARGRHLHPRPLVARHLQFGAVDGRRRRARVAARDPAVFDAPARGARGRGRRRPRAARVARGGPRRAGGLFRRDPVHAGRAGGRRRRRPSAHRAGSVRRPVRRTGIFAISREEEGVYESCDRERELETETK